MIFPIMQHPTPPRMPLLPAERQAEAERLYGDIADYVLAQVPALMELEIVNAVSFPHPSLVDIYESGNAEPWTSQLVASLLIASNQRNVIETGVFTGQTSGWLAMALERLGGGTLTLVDIDPARVEMATARVMRLGLTCVEVKPVVSDILQFIPTLPDESVGFVWIDDCHEKPHVEVETRLLWDKMKHGGIMTFHDVVGSCDLQTIVKKYGGVSLDLPRLGAAGGVGIVQRP